MPLITQQSVISDDALEAPLVLQKNLVSLVGTAKELIDRAKQYNDLLGASTKTSEDHRQRTKDLSDEQRVLAQITKQVATESAKQNDVYQLLLARKRELVQQNKESQLIDAEDAKLVNAKTSSIERLTQALARNKQSWAQLGSEKQRNSTEGKKLLSTIQDQASALEKLQPVLKQTQEHQEGLVASLERMGEGGERASGILTKLAEVATSGWGLVAAGVGAAAEGIKLFFERTEAGEVIYENALTQLSVRFDQFKNQIATGIKDFLPEDIGTEQRKQRLRAAQIANLRSQIVPNRDNTEIEKRIKDIEKEYQLSDAILRLTTGKIELEQKEAILINDRTDKLAKAAKLELVARESADKTAKERLSAITEADALYRDVQSKEIKLAEERAQLQLSDIYLRAQGRELTAAEFLETQKIIEAAKQVGIEYDKAAKKRTSLIASLKKEVAGKTLGADEKGGDSFYDDLLPALKKAQDEEARLKKIQDDKELKDQQEADKLIFDEQVKIQSEEVKQADKRYEKFKEREKDLEEHKIELTRIGSDSVVKIVNDQFDAQIAAHDRYLIRVRENYQEEMQLAAGNKIAQAQLTSEFREREKREQLEIVKLKRKQAQFDRDVTALVITLKTAEAIMADVAKYPETAGQPFASFDAAIGAAQMTAIFAKPLPSYDVGTDFHEGGPALVHPFELYKTPGGDIGLTPDEPTIMGLPRGTEVATQDETIRMLALAGLTNSFSFERKSVFNDKVLNELKEVKKAIKEQRQEKENLYSAMAGYYKFKKESETFAKKILIEKFGR